MRSARCFDKGDHCVMRRGKIEGTDGDSSDFETLSAALLSIVLSEWSHKTQLMTCSKISIRCNGL